jgi:Transcriptional regulators
MNDYTMGLLVWLRLVQFKNRSDQMTNEFLKRFELTTAQFDVLVQIRTYQPLNQMELAKKVTMTLGGFRGCLPDWKRNDISRKQGWKTKMISLTEKGESVMNEAFPVQLAFQTSFFDEVLSKEEQKTLLSLISRLEKHSRNKMIPPPT